MRVATAFSTLILSLAAVTACGSDTTAPPAVAADTLPLATLDGRWQNEKSDGAHITRYEISVAPASVRVQFFYSCDLGECTSGAELGDARMWESNRELDVVWKDGSIVDKQTLTYLPDKRLRVTTFSHYTDETGRTDMEETEYFIRG